MKYSNKIKSFKFINQIILCLASSFFALSAAFGGLKDGPIGSPDDTRALVYGAPSNLLLANQVASAIGIGLLIGKLFEQEDGNPQAIENKKFDDEIEEIPDAIQDITCSNKMLTIVFRTGLIASIGSDGVAAVNKDAKFEKIPDSLMKREAGKFVRNAAGSGNLFCMLYRERQLEIKNAILGRQRYFLDIVQSPDENRR